MATMSDKAKWGYLAGMMDGDGHISITRSDCPTHKTRHGKIVRYTDPVRYGIVVAVSNTDIRLVKHLKEMFGGSYNGGKPFKGHPNWKPKYQWNVSGNQNKELVLLALLPYLILKREQAIIALEFLRLRNERVPEKRQELYERLAVLNKRGKLVEANTSCGSDEELKIESDLVGNSESEDQVTDLIGTNHGQFSGDLLESVRIMAGE
jgi:hypothetical protein